MSAEFLQEVYSTVAADAQCLASSWSRLGFWNTGDNEQCSSGWFQRLSWHVRTQMVLKISWIQVWSLTRALNFTWQLMGSPCRFLSRGVTCCQPSVSLSSLADAFCARWSFWTRLKGTLANWIIGCGNHTHKHYNQAHALNYFIGSNRMPNFSRGRGPCGHQRRPLQANLWAPYWQTLNLWMKKVLQSYFAPPRNKHIQQWKLKKLQS